MNKRKEYLDRRVDELRMASIISSFYQPEDLNRDSTIDKYRHRQIKKVCYRRAKRELDLPF